MIQRILGVDTGTNSLGWAVVDYNAESEGDKYKLVMQGVNIFQEGVKLEKGIESSRAAERTAYRHLRIGYWRRKLRKIALLRLLMEYDLCPKVDDEQLKEWRQKKVYPHDDRFRQWLLTDDNESKNPYYYRYLCLNEKLDLTKKENRLILGRALYHLNQRRGFLSNRKEDTRQSDGAVKQGISQLNDEMKAAGCECLGQYFYQLYQRGERIRANYTDRLDHYDKELLAICDRQSLDIELTKRLHKVIITQRPLKSQKHSVGHCVYERQKSRCPVSHPLFEQYRMYAFVNNIKIQTPHDDNLRVLTDEEKSIVVPLFLRKSKTEFKFDDIAKKLSGTKNNYCYYKSDEQKAYRFNYQMDQMVAGCPVTAQLCEVFEQKADVDSWLDLACEVYTQGQGKSRYEILNDIWHALFFFDNVQRLQAFAEEKLQLDSAHAEMFSKIRIPSDYASLSLKAIRKILPYMKVYGMIYSHAVFMANLHTVIKSPTNADDLLPMLSRDIADDIVEAFNDYGKHATEVKTREEYVKLYVCSKYNVDMSTLECLYHPSMVETFPKVLIDHPTKGCLQLGSPRTNSVRNPMAMHSLFRMRHVINTLLAKGVVDQDTIIRIEFARELNDANKRAAIRQWQRDKERKHKEYADKIREIIGHDYIPTADDILKYELWEEQNHICLYTGETIKVSDLFNANRFDIEHTIPRSVGGDSTMGNLTLCQSRFNRETKRAKMPSELANHDEIIERVACWKERINDLESQLRRLGKVVTSDKETKDRLIQKRHRLIIDRDYWRDKYARFVMTEVPEGFSRRQGNDIGVISRYARLYLKSLFHHVSVVKGVTTAEFRRIWGLQSDYEKKSRINHCHHVVDAVTIACIGKAEYDKLAHYYLQDDNRKWGLAYQRPYFDKPWATFTEDLMTIEESLLVKHYNKDNTRKHTRKRNRDTNCQYIQGDTARGALHQETYYGAIEREGEIRYVVRRDLSTLTEKDIPNIVDDVVRQNILGAIQKYGSLKKAIEENGIWMNREKGVAIKKVRCYASQVKRPIHIRKHRDESAKEYKRTYHVTNDTNYAMGIYVGTDKKGKEKRQFELVNRLDAVTHYRRSNDIQGDTLMPITSVSGFPLQYILRIGQMVLLYEKTPAELHELEQKDLVRRLYKVTGLSSMVLSNRSYGTITLVYHQEARRSTDIKSKNGAFKNGEDLRPSILMLHTQFCALVEGQDFTLDEDGTLQFKKQ